MQQTDAASTADMTTKPIDIHVGHSPDPDDAFMFYALAKELIDTSPYRFSHEMADIETLNRRALGGDLEVTAISLHAYPFLKSAYALLSCGCSMGDGYGPMVVARKPMPPDQLKGLTIAIPGERTTAFLALNLCLGAETYAHKVVMFDEIPDAVARGDVDAGLIIHEAQLTYPRQGLHKVIDVAEWWGERTGLPLPLGGNVVRRDLGAGPMVEVARHLKDAVQYALDHRTEAIAYALSFGRGLDTELTDRFVEMYVNKWTLDYGERGRRAVRELLQQAHDAGLVPDPGNIEFIG